MGYLTECKWHVSGNNTSVHEQHLVALTGKVATSKDILQISLLTHQNSHKGAHRRNKTGVSL